MSDHLDECPEVFIDCYGSSCDCEYSHFCICDALRSCEERVRRENVLLSVSRIRGYADALITVREAIAEIHQPVPVIECACGWGVTRPECGSESNRTVGYVCRICCDDWDDHGYCDDMHYPDDTPLHHVGGMWSGPYCPVLAAIDALKEKP